MIWDFAINFFAGGILYNSLPLELQQVDDSLLFKRRLKEHFHSL